jgi:hypothetical protein
MGLHAVSAGNIISYVAAADGPNSAVLSCVRLCVISFAAMITVLLKSRNL